MTAYDFAPYWWDPNTEGASNGVYLVGKGVGWYVDGAKRYVATTWPKKQFAWFDKTNAITSFASRPGGAAAVRRATARAARRAVPRVRRARPATRWWCSRRAAPAWRPL